MNRCTQNGFTLVGALFILIVLALLGAAMVTISGSHQSTAADAATTARAYYAARSGVEWGAAAAAANCAAANGAPAFPGYPEYTVTVACNDGGAHTENGVTYGIFQITATATLTGVPLADPRYVSRTITLVMTSPNAPL